MPEFVRARSGDIETTVTREYADVMGLEVLDGEPLYAHGRLRGATRSGGRRIKPRALPKKRAAIPTTDSASTPADGETGGVAADTTKE